MPFFNWEPEMSNKPGLLNLLAGKTQLVNSFNDWEMEVSQLRAGQEQRSEKIKLKIVVA